MINNLSQLKKHFATLPEFEIVGHCRKEMVGQVRKVNICDTSGIYSIISTDPDAKESRANGGRGSWLGWSKAAFWKFENGIASIYTSDTKEEQFLIMAMKVG